MLARQVVLLTPSESFHPTQLLSRQQSTPGSPLAATLMNFPASVANKRLTAWLSPLDSTLTKNRGGGVMVNLHPSAERRAWQVFSHAGPPFRPRSQSVSTPDPKLTLCTDGSVAIGG